MKKAYDANIQVCFHAIGDEGQPAGAGLDGQGVRGCAGASADRRWRIEHAQILQVEDIVALQGAGRHPSMQPSHAIGDLYFAPARHRADGGWRAAYAWRALIDAGVDHRGRIGCAGGAGRSADRVLCGRGAQGSARASRRRDWHPEQAVTREEALKMFTHLAGLCLVPGRGSRHDRDGQAGGLHRLQRATS